MKMVNLYCIDCKRKILNRKKAHLIEINEKILFFGEKIAKDDYLNDGYLCEKCHKLLEESKECEV
ncbi:hypothetical protein ES708_25547 [subsurface metagenome]